MGAQEEARVSIFLVLAAAGILPPELGASDDNSRLVKGVRDLMQATDFLGPEDDLDRIEEIRRQVIEVLNEDVT